MSALGQKRTLQSMEPMSALPPKADIETQSRDVRFVPKADIPAYADLAAKGVDQFSSLFDDEHYCNLCGFMVQRTTRGSDRSRWLVQARPQLSTLATSVAGLTLSSSKRASTRSGMSKPSVNQP